jgi:hypothetical protein
MNDATRTQLKILVERTVRPVRAGEARKRTMREELFAHVSAVFEEETDRLGDEDIALARTMERFGDPGELVAELQDAVPARDALERFVDYLWFRPHESTLRRAMRHSAIAGLLVLAVLGGTALFVNRQIGAWPVDALALSLSVFSAFFLFVFSFTFLAEWMRQALHSDTGRSPLKPMIVAAAGVALVLALGLWLEFARLRAGDLALVAAQGAVIAAVLLHTANLIAERHRHHQEWATLPIDG